MAAATKEARKAMVAGAEYTDSSLAKMKTSEIAALVASIRGGNPPKPAIKAKAIELFWKAAETLPEVAEAPQSGAEVPEATTKPRGTEKRRRGKAEKVGAQSAETKRPRKANKRAKLYSITDGAAVEGMTPQARELADAMKAAGKPLSMAQCAALLQVRRNSRGPERVVAWYFSRIFRPVGILVESRDGRGA